MMTSTFKKESKKILTNIPEKWAYDTENRKLSMLFKHGLSTYLIREKAFITESIGASQIAVSDSTGEKYILMEAHKA
ncbi:hypothetical protein IKF23_03745 [Candidatus Saccharibacteria bacterium]|nr:hypothetical protein [Candidatus Saccharibacteria bacterium]